MDDEHTSRHSDSRPFGCDLRQLLDLSIVAYKVLTLHEMLETKPGQIIQIDGEEFVTDYVGPLGFFP